MEQNVKEVMLNKWRNKTSHTRGRCAVASVIARKVTSRSWPAAKAPSDGTLKCPKSLLGTWVLLRNRTQGRGSAKAAL